MPDSNTWLLVGVGIGIGIGLGAALLWRQRADAIPTEAGAQAPVVTSHDVHRSESGRIQTVETVQYVGTTGAIERQIRPTDAA